jgi:hypothetical protein
MQSCFPFLVFTLLITYSHMYLADGRMCSCPDCHAYLLSACPLVHVRARSQKGCGNDATRQFCKVPGTNEHAVLWSGLSLSTNLLHSSHEILRSSLITYSVHGLQEKDYRDISEDAAQKQIAHGEKSCTSRLGYFCGQVRLCGASANGIQQTHPNPNTSIFFRSIFCSWLLITHAAQGPSWELRDLRWAAVARATASQMQYAGSSVFLQQRVAAVASSHAAVLL